MEKLISIDLSSEFGFFKNPQFNGEIDNKSYSFDSIHKLSVYGLLGRLIGLNGLDNSSNTFPEYYEKLRDIKVGIEIQTAINKSWQSTTSSSGLYSDSGKNSGATLIMRKDVITKPRYRIYLLLDLSDENHNKVYKHLKDNIEPYFGYLYFGKSSFIVERNNFKDHDYEKVEDFTGRVKTLFSSDFNIPRSRRGNNTDNVYDIDFIFSSNKEVIFQREVSIPNDYIERDNGSISYGNIIPFNFTNKKIEISNESETETIIKLNEEDAICVQ